MEEINTHAFVGGPKDGQRELMRGADIERGSVTVRSYPPADLAPPRDGAIPTSIAITEATYERTAYQGEKVRFIFWKARGLTLDDALRSLFAHYINR